MTEDLENYDNLIPRRLVRFSNGMIMAFNASGEQIPELQGNDIEALDVAIACSNQETEFYLGEWGHQMRKVSQEEFEYP